MVFIRAKGAYLVTYKSCFMIAKNVEAISQIYKFERRSFLYYKTPYAPWLMINLLYLFYLLTKSTIIVYTAWLKCPIISTTDCSRDFFTFDTNFETLIEYSLWIFFSHLFVHDAFHFYSIMLGFQWSALACNG